MKRSAICLLSFAVAVAAKADYWMTFGRTPGGQ